MKKLFSLDGVVYRKWSFLADLVILNIFFVLCSIPIITIVPAFLSLVSCIRMLKENGTIKIWSSFTAHFKEFLTSGMKVTLVLIISAIVLGFETIMISQHLNSLFFELLLKFCMLLLLMTINTSFLSYLLRFKRINFTGRVVYEILFIGFMSFDLHLVKIILSFYLTVLVSLFFASKIILVFWLIIGFSLLASQTESHFKKIDTDGFKHLFLSRL